MTTLYVFRPYEKKKAVVRLRRGPGWNVKPRAEVLDGKTVDVSAGWVMDKEDTSIYLGEVAWVLSEEDMKKYGTTWLASGDLEFLE